MPAESPPSAAGDGGQPVAGALEALPSGSKAPEHVKYLQSKQVCSFTFQHEDGQKTAFQVTVKQASGSADCARRVAELCYGKFEAGWPKDKVLAYRDDLCRKCRPAGGKRSAVDAQAGASPKRPRAAAGGESLLEVLEREGRLKGALRIEGRLASKRNHESINGVFARLLSGHDGRSAYEKVVLDDAGLRSAERFLFFSAAGKRWKISDVLGDGKGGFCYLRTSDGGEGPPVTGGGSERWFVFDGKGAGYNADDAVQSALLVPTEAAGAGPSAGGAAAEAAAAGVGGAEGAESSSSGSSSGSDEEGQPEPASQQSQPSRPSKTGAGGPPAHVAEPGVPSRVCAKAAVRSGLRCACHYTYTPECPAMSR